MIYSLNEWAKPPTEIDDRRGTVRLDGYRLQPVNTVEVLGLNCKKIVLLVVSPQADPDQAHAIMMTAAGPNNALTVDSLLRISAEEAKPAHRPIQAPITQERWESMEPALYRLRIRFMAGGTCAHFKHSLPPGHADNAFGGLERPGIAMRRIDR